jgi:hypothetical protein
MVESRNDMLYNSSILEKLFYNGDNPVSFQKHLLSIILFHKGEDRMKSVDLLLNIMIFVGMSLLMGAVCINMPNTKDDNRNTGAGYRTKRSMKSIECWNVGNKIFGYCAVAIAIMEGLAIYLEDIILIRQKLILSGQVIFINLFILILGIFIGYLITENKLKHLL